MTTVNTSGRFVGDWPRIGIRPAVDGRLARGARVAGGADPEHGAPHRRAPPREPPLPGRQPGRGRRPGPQHRRRVRGGQGRRDVPPGGRRRLAHGHALLVLRLRDHGHGPAHAQGGLGLQRHRAAGRGLPRRGARGAHPEGAARLRHLRPRRPGRRRRRRSPTTSRRKLLRFARAGLAAAILRGKSYLCDGRRLDGHRRLDRRPAVLRALPRDAGRDRRHDRVHPPDGGGHLRPGRVRAGARLGAGELPGGRGPQPRRQGARAARSWTATGSSWSRWR